MEFEYLYGTAWKEEVTADCVYNALKVGYRAVDTANQRKHYNEPGVGEGLKKAYRDLGLKREDLFLQTKFTYASGQDHRKPYNEDDPYRVQVRDSFNSSLQNLHSDYLDSLILHGPFSSVGIADEDKQVWQEFEALYSEGLVKNLGVSNVSTEQLKELYELATVKPKFAQIRCFASNQWEKPTRDFCIENDIVFQGFSLLTANREYIGAEYKEVAGQKVPKLILTPENKTSQKFAKIIKDTGKEPAQIIFRFCHQIGILPITGTRTIENMKLNLDIKDFELSPEQVEIIECIALKG